MARESCQRAFGAVIELDLTCVFESDVLPSYLILPSGGRISMLIPCTVTVLFSWFLKFCKTMLEKFALLSCLASLIPWLSLAGCAGLPAWCPLEVELLACDVFAHCCSLLVVKLCEYLYLKLLDSLFSPMAATQSGWLHSVALCLGVAWPDACLVNKLAGVQWGLWAFEEELAE